MEQKNEKFLSYVEKVYGLNREKLDKIAMGWFNKLYEPYKNEFSGIAEASGCLIDIIAQSYYFDRCIDECCLNSHIKREMKDSYIIATNHYVATDVQKDIDFADSISRYNRLDTLLSERKSKDVIKEYISYLGDDGVEKRGLSSGAVYSNIACPSRDLILFSSNNFPVASEGTWEDITIK